MTTTKTKNNFIENPLDTLFSARIRLSDDERATLRKAHADFRKSFASAPVATVMAGSSVTVETAVAPPRNAYAEAGMSDLVVSDLIGSRDSIQLSILLKMEELLGVKIVDRKRMVDRFENYLDYLGIN